MDALQSLYQKALLEHPTCFVFCGPSEQAFANSLPALLPFLAREYCVVLTSDTLSLEAENPGLRIVRDSEVGATDFLRSVLRQDPDGVILDSRATDGMDILVQAKLTGHRVFFHHTKPAKEAFRDCLERCSKNGSAQASAFLGRSLFLELGTEGVTRAHLVRQKANSDISLEVLLEKSENGSWESLSPYQGPSEPEPLEETEVMSVPPEWPQEGEQFLDELRAKFTEYVRCAWAPELGSDGEAGDYGQFGGVPKLEKDERWPLCGCCGEPMGLVLQLRLRKAPEPLQQKMGDQGYFQFFYCLSDHCSVETPWEPFQQNSLVRVTRGELMDPSEELVKTYSAKPIVGWTELLDGPGYEERRTLDMDRDLLEDDRFFTLSEMAATWPDSDGYYNEILQYFGLTEETALEVYNYIRPLPGDKLLGWPAWSQGVEYPNCPECDTPMEMLLQINNDGHGDAGPGYSSALGQVFAADGNGHIFYCPKHSHLTFAWACG